MSLADYQPARHEFKLNGGSVVVGPISSVHLAILIREHLPDLEAVLELIQSGQKISLQQGTEFITALVGEAPGLAANIIALAANEPDSAKSAEALPFPVQVEILQKVAELTFTEVGGVKKFLGMIATLLKANPKIRENVTRTLTKARSSDSISESAAT